MKKYLFTLALTLCVLISNAADKGSWTGVISDDHCGVKKANAEHAECAKQCIAGGKTMVLVVGNKMYKISDPKKLEEYIGKKVTVKGDLKGDTIEVTGVEKA
jgi:hypothetical protein